MSLALIFATSLLIGFSGAMMPGPVSAMAVTEGARRGFWAGPLITLGHGLAELAIVAGLAFGLGRVLALSFVSALIGLLGGTFLLWMGYSIIRDTRRGIVSLELAPAKAQGMTRFGPVGAGLLTSVANPYWVLWWATIGAGYVILSLEAGIAGLLAFYLGHILSDLSWNSLLSFLVASGRHRLHEGIYRRVLIACGFFLMIFSLYFLWSGIRFLRG
jgi:threonine/homoserine/homoserine lactone efflux protein